MLDSSCGKIMIVAHGESPVVTQGKGPFFARRLALARMHDTDVSWWYGCNSR